MALFARRHSKTSLRSPMVSLDSFTSQVLEEHLSVSSFPARSPMFHFKSRNSKPKLIIVLQFQKLLLTLGFFSRVLFFFLLLFFHNKMLWEVEIVLRDEINAGLVVSDCIGREVAAQLDLEEAVEASRYASHPYSTHPREWPPFIEVVDTWDLPPVLIERYSAAGGEGTALCGIFPEIRRA